MGIRKIVSGPPDKLGSTVKNLVKNMTRPTKEKQAVAQRYDEKLNIF